LSRDAPAAARHFAVAAVCRLGAADLSDDTALVVTELAANAVRHAGSGFTLTLSCQPEVLLISVRDTRPLPAGPAAAALPPKPLHGLGAVDVLASRWGVEPLGHAGKSVWVELPR
jgi:anti-sigma regulatory factor (Ser/Thr protein kinase)